jgi:hypothetical protein
MWRKTLLALTAILALGTVSIASDAFARSHGGGGHGGGHGGGGHFGGGHFGHFRGRGGFGFYGPAYNYYGDGCYQWRRIWTPYGWRVRRVYVCYY